MVRLLLVSLIGLGVFCWSEAASSKVWSRSSIKKDAHEETGVYRVSLQNKNNQVYCGTVGLGSPEKLFSVAFDNSLPSTWVIDSSCNIGECNKRQKYDGSKSTTHKEDGRAYPLFYEDKVMNGILNVDTLQMGGAIILNQTFAASMAFPDESFPCDGVISVQKGSIVIGTDFDFPMQNMMKQYLLNMPVFSIYLSKDEKDKGEIIFGGYDKTYYEGDITWVDTPDSIYWIYKMSKVQLIDSRISGKALVTLCDRGCKSWTWSMTPFTYINDKDFHTLNMALGATPYDKNHYKFDNCKYDSNLTLELSIGDLVFKITSDQYVHKMEKSDGIVCLSSISSYADGSNDSFWALGYTFMRAIYTIYDVAGKRMGLAQSK